MKFKMKVLFGKEYILPKTFAFQNMFRITKNLTKLDRKTLIKNTKKVRKIQKNYKMCKILISYMSQEGVK